MKHIPLAFLAPARRAGLAALFLTLAALCASCGDSGLPSFAALPDVAEWAEAGPGDVMRVVEASGIVRATDKGFVRVGSRLKGQVMRMHVRTGDIVRAGQILAELDDRELQAMRSQAVARLESARNEVVRLESERDKRLEGARAALEVERGRQQYADRLSERRKALREEGHIAQDALDQSRRDALTTGQMVAQGTSALSRIAKEIEHALASARRGVEEAQAQVDQADTLISMTRVESPIDGIVGQILTQEGEQVVAEVEAVKIVTIIDPRFLELWIYINEADAAGVQPGMSVRFFKPSSPGQIMGAHVDRVSPAPELIDRVLYYPAIASLAQAASLYLRPEMSVRCFVQVEDLKGALSVPNQAVQARAGKRFVYVDNGAGKARMAEPVFGVRGTERTQVLSGLTAGTRVAVKLAPTEGK